MSADVLLGLVNEFQRLSILFGKADPGSDDEEAAADAMNPAHDQLHAAIRDVCEERDRLREELAAANQQIFDLTLKVNNPAWLPGI